MLEEIVRALRDRFAVDVVTNKGDCLDLLRQNEFEVIVACERLADGSGLELLGQIAKRWPATLRVFAADRERLRLLQGRLGPFELFQTLAYPIDPRKLLETLSLASAAQNADADTTNIQHVVMGGEEDERDAPVPAEAPPAARVAPAAAVAPAAPVAVRQARSAAAAKRKPVNLHPTPLGPAEREWTRPVALPPASFKIEPVVEEPAANRTAFVVGAVAVVLLGATALAVRFWGGGHPSAPAPAVAAPPPARAADEVADLVARIEADFKEDNFRGAEADIRTLSQTAPQHPRLPFFQKLLANENRRHGKSPAAAASAPAAARASPPTQIEPTAPAAAPVAAAPRSPAGTSFSGRTLEQSEPPPTPLPDTASSGRGAAQRRTLAPPPGTQEAQLIHRVAPEYPTTAARQRIEGFVDVQFLITREGTVENITISNASPADIFDRAAIAAVSAWRYNPRVVEGQPVASPEQVRVEFKLDPQAAAP